MTLFEIIAPPIIGGIIGYTTNVIAVKMLFWPRRAVKIGRFQVPFTPGVIPRRKNKLAGVLGKAISDQFWGHSDLESVFTSETFKSAVAERIMVIISSPDTTLAFLDPYQKNQSAVLNQVKDELCIRIQAAILKSDLKSLISDQYTRIMHERFGDGMVSKVFNERTFSVVLDPLVNLIEKDLLENGREYIMPLIDEELFELSREPVSNIINEIIPDKDAQLAFIGDVYTRFMDSHVRPIVESIDIEGLVTEKVQQMDSTDVEKLTLSVVARELRYVMLLGGLIGALIGIANIFI